MSIEKKYKPSSRAEKPECAEVDPFLLGTRQKAAAAILLFRERQLTVLWNRLGSLDAALCRDLQQAVKNWHDIAVVLRGNE
jgi:ABC-type thiamine transport system ATPase subunit